MGPSLIRALLASFVGYPYSFTQRCIQPGILIPQTLYSTNIPSSSSGFHMMKELDVEGEDNNEFWRDPETERVLLSGEKGFKVALPDMEKKAKEISRQRLLAREKEGKENEQLIRDAEEDLMRRQRRIDSSSVKTQQKQTPRTSSPAKDKDDPSYWGVDSTGLGLRGRWVEKYGNYILYPKNVTPIDKKNSDLRDNSERARSGSSEQPLGVIHFLGGAFVGAAPHITYKYLLETLCDAGMLLLYIAYYVI
jgi:hypothetical protein